MSDATAGMELTALTPSLDRYFGTDRGGPHATPVKDFGGRGANFE